MKQPSLCSLSLYSSFIILLLVVDAQPENIKIIHLGDSYSSGSGLDIDDDGWYGPRWCFQHLDAWGHQAVGFVQRSSGVHLDYTNHAWKVLQLYLIAFANHIY